MVLYIIIRRAKMYLFIQILKNAANIIYVKKHIIEKGSCRNETVL